LAREKKISIGIDVHKESWQATAISEGEELLHGRMPGGYSGRRKLLDRLVDCQIRVAYEAGCCGFGLYDRLRADGIEALVGFAADSPSMVNCARRMEKTLQVLNVLERDGALSRYAIGGAMGATFYAEPVLTFDLDIFVILPQTADGLLALEPLYAALRARGYTEEGECVNIEGIPVQFLPAYNNLLVEALAEARETLYEQTPLESCAQNIWRPLLFKPDVTRTANVCGCYWNRHCWTTITLRAYWLATVWQLDGKHGYPEAGNRAAHRCKGATPTQAGRAVFRRKSARRGATATNGATRLAGAWTRGAGMGARRFKSRRPEMNPNLTWIATHARFGKPSLGQELIDLGPAP